MIFHFCRNFKSKLLGVLRIALMAEDLRLLVSCLLYCALHSLYFLYGYPSVSYNLSRCFNGFQSVSVFHAVLQLRVILKVHHGSPVF